MTESELIGLGYAELQGMMLSPNEPAKISMWPETQIWLYLALSIFVLLVYVANRWYCYRKRTAYRRAAIYALKTVGDDGNAIADILRRTALVAFPRAQVAALHGENWLKFLDKTLVSSAINSSKCFESDAGRQMLVAPYRNKASCIAGLNALACHWIRHHRQEEKL